MPRRHRAARDRPGPPAPSPRPRTAAPVWASADGMTVRTVSGETGKVYRCPGCQQEIKPGTPHLVVMTEGGVEGRRHWHTPCWRQERRRRGLG